ncbi:cytochrome P450 107B1 (P450CVIIB1) [Streptomyces himastatinicus ATCC 53653]|uniref:Cytochrome P450 107B1 (P450CVIIB1) n=1 Tax=Streptomyces himastatinicus ATCC 53653 TaxID=457427 RepID=D9WIU9_9ACTN|nr:cytochrome P450 [Streptomyces himastatinicus]EFL27602.1 cytochrome P450 107B1 (P450CVIIB1) [Streptomyces himastatinicus ATCC 53653]
MSTVPEGEPLIFNPFTPDFMNDPYPHYAELRREVPVHEHPGGFWMLSRYQDVFDLLRSSLSVEQRHVAPGPFRDAYEKAGVTDEPRLKGLALLDRDPPDQTRLRKLVTQAFTVRAVTAMEPRIRALVTDALDTFAEAGGGDLVETLAFPLPFTVISDMLGMPPTDTRHMRELTGTLMRSVEPTTDPVVMRAVEAADAELFELVGDAVAWKRNHLADDLLSALIAAEDDGDKLTHDELVAQVTMLYVAGHETTVNLISGGTLALLRNPDQLELLRAKPELEANAVEEMLRYDAPVHNSRRVTLEPYQVGEYEIPPGSFILANLAGANRDEEFFGPDAEELRLDRENARRHVSFGGGIHLCLGATLARIEGRVAIGELVRRFPDLALDGEVEWNGLLSLRGAARLPIRV